MKNKLKIKWLVGVTAFLTMLATAAVGVASDGHGHKASQKVGILLVAFGSSEASAQVPFDNIDKKVRANGRHCRRQTD